MKCSLWCQRVEFSVCLVENVGDEMKRVPRFAKYLLKALMQGDEAGMKLAARAIAYLIQTSKTFAAELVEKSINQVFLDTKIFLNLFIACVLFLIRSLLLALL